MGSYETHQSPLSITLVRHAETDWSQADKHTGLTDIPLNTKGKREAALLHTCLTPNHYSHIFISPLMRAVETAKLAGLLEKGVIEPNLVEWDYGKYEGLTSIEIHQHDPDWNIFTGGGPGGETVEDAVKRAERVLKRLSHLSGHVLLVSSGHISRLIATCWLEVPPSFGKHLALSPASRSVLGWEGNTRAILTWNQPY